MEVCAQWRISSQVQPWKHTQTYQLERDKPQRSGSDVWAIDMTQAALSLVGQRMQSTWVVYFPEHGRNPRYVTNIIRGITGSINGSGNDEKFQRDSGQG